MSRPIDHAEGSGSLMGTNDFSEIVIESPPEHANTDTGLYIAVQRGDVKEVRGILHTPSNWWCNKKRFLTQMDKNGRCPVHIAAKEGRHDIIKEFIEFMPNCVNIRDKDDKTTLHVAVEHGQLEVVKVLLSDKNAKIVRKMVSGDRDKDGNTALHLAAIREVEPQIVRELLKWPGVCVNEVNTDGLSALDIAAHSSLISPQWDKRIKSGKIKKILEAVVCGGRCSSHSEGKESKLVNVDTVVASLIATVTFAAIFQIPGGIETDINSSMYGGARFALTDGFLWFSILNTLALFTSLTVVVMWLLHERLPGKFVNTNRSIVPGLSAICLGVSIVSTGLAFLFAYFEIVPPVARPPVASPVPSPVASVSSFIEDKEGTHKLRVLLLSVIWAACFVPGIAWTSFSLVFVKRLFTGRLMPIPKSVLCTWLAIPMPLLGFTTYVFAKKKIDY